MAIIKYFQMAEVAILPEKGPGKKTAGLGSFSNKQHFPSPYFSCEFLHLQEKRCLDINNLMTTLDFTNRALQQASSSGGINLPKALQT